MGPERSERPETGIRPRRVRWTRWPPSRIW